MRTGAVFFPSAPFGTRITVYSLTPSRIGIITSMATRTLAKPLPDRFVDRTGTAQHHNEVGIFQARPVDALLLDEVD